MSSAACRFGRYPKTEVLNLARFISVAKFRPLVWRNTHPYVLRRLGLVRLCLCAVPCRTPYRVSATEVWRCSYAESTPLGAARRSQVRHRRPVRGPHAPRAAQGERNSHVEVHRARRMCRATLTCARARVGKSAGAAEAVGWPWLYCWRYCWRYCLGPSQRRRSCGCRAGRTEVRPHDLAVRLRPRHVLATEHERAHPGVSSVPATQPVIRPWRCLPARASLPRPNLRAVLAGMAIR